MLSQYRTSHSICYLSTALPIANAQQHSLVYGASMLSLVAPYALPSPRHYQGRARRAGIAIPDVSTAKQYHPTRGSVPPSSVTLRQGKYQTARSMIHHP
eukprot:2415737-Rhodomonas_salina.1